MTTPQPTVAELAEAAFVKAEYVQMLRELNTPQTYDERKKAFVRLAEAEAALTDATTALNKATGKLD